MRVWLKIKKIERLASAVCFKILFIAPLLQNAALEEGRALDVAGLARSTAARPPQFSWPGGSELIQLLARALSIFVRPASALLCAVPTARASLVHLQGCIVHGGAAVALVLAIPGLWIRPSQDFGFGRSRASHPGPFPDPPKRCRG